MKLNSAVLDSAADWMKSSAESVWDLIPQECGPLPTCGAGSAVPECSDLLLNVEDDVRDDSISVDHRRSKSLLDVEASVDSRDRKELCNDTFSIAAMRDPVHEAAKPSMVQKKANAPVSPRPKNLPIGRFRKKAAASPIRYPTPENAVSVSDKRSTLSPFDAAARSNASWQQKMAAMQAMKQQTRAATATEQSKQGETAAEKHVEERQETPGGPQETQKHKDPSIKREKTESTKEAKQEESFTKNKQPRSIMRSTNSARREEKVKFHQEPSSNASTPETKESKEMEKQPKVQEQVEEKQKDDYDSVSSLEDPLEEPQGIILNLNQLQNLKNPDYHPVGEPKVIRQIPQQQKKTKKPILGFLKRRKNEKEIMGRAYK